MRDIEALKKKHAKEIEDALREEKIRELMPETAAEQSFYFHELYGEKGHIDLKSGQFRRKWATIEDCLEMARRFPSIRCQIVKGTFTSIIAECCEDAYLNNGRNDIKERIQCADVTFRTTGITSSNHVDAEWFTLIGSEVFKVSIALNPSWGYRLNFRINELPGRIQVETEQPAVWTPPDVVKGACKYWSPDEQPASHSIWMTGHRLTALEFFEALQAKK